MLQALEKLNIQQKEAVIHDSGPLLIVAGAGTGKTTVISQRIAYLINTEKCKPEEILALTFTDKAAGEMEERVDQLLPYGYVDLWISTFHSFAERILKEHALDIGLSNDFNLLNPTKQWLLVRQNLEKFKLDYYKPLGNPTKFIHALLRHFSRAKDENISCQDYLDYVNNLNSDNANDFINESDLKKLSAEEISDLANDEIKKQTEVAEAYQVYQQLLLDNNSLDFGDLINYCLKLFRTRKNLLLKYQSQFKYILVDEFQDTNLAQYELIKLLASPKNNITVVGDDDQSVYKFRGASVSNILHYKDDFPDAKEIFLNNNYRSAQGILDLSYDFICQNNPNRLEVKLSSTNNKLSKKLISSSNEKAEIMHLHGKTLQDEVAMTVNKIIDLYNKDESPKWSDFAILVRANSNADDFLYALDKAKVPYNFCASKGLYAKRIIIDLLSYLRLLDNHHEGPAMYRIISLPVYNLSHHDIVNLNYWSGRKGLSLFEILKEASIYKIDLEVVKKIELILNQLSKGAQMARDNKKTTEIIHEFLNSSGYLKSLTEDSLENREQINYLNQFYKKIKEFEKDNSGHGLKAFMDLVNLELESGEEGSIAQNFEDSGPDTVKIMTVHAAKGLEFKYVFIVNMVDKRFPAIGKSDPIELPAKLIKEIIPEGDVHLQEERRLFYVAMTRAKQGLYFASASDYGGSRSKKLSKFLIELEQFGLQLSQDSLRIRPEDVYSDILKSETPDEIRVYAPSKFSFTQIKAFENCPYQYRFAHILRIPTTGKPSFSFGTTMHSTLQKFFILVSALKDSKQGDLFNKEIDNHKVPTFEELIKLYEESFIDDWYPDKKTKEEYFAKGIASLKLFYDSYLQRLPEAINLEYGFNLKIGEYSVKGKIDRIDKLGDGIKIVDYKTGKAKDKLSADDKEQLLIYQIAAEEVLGKKVNELSFYYLEEGREETFLGTDKELNKTKEKIIAVAEKIKEGSFLPNPTELCKYCDFNLICEYRK